MSLAHLPLILLLVLQGMVLPSSILSKHGPKTAMDFLNLAQGRQSSMKNLIDARQQAVLASCPGRGDCLGAQEVTGGLCQWNERIKVLAQNDKNPILAVFYNTMVNKCEKNGDQAHCCPYTKPSTDYNDYTECIYDDNISKAAMHQQCHAKQRCIFDSVIGIYPIGKCDSSQKYCSLNDGCVEINKPICNDDRQCEGCKQDSDCSNKKPIYKFCENEACVKCKKTAKPPHAGCVDTTSQPNKDNPVCLKEGCGNHLTCKIFPYQTREEHELEVRVTSPVGQAQLNCHFHYTTIKSDKPRTWRCTPPMTKTYDYIGAQPAPAEIDALVKACRRGIGPSRWTGDYVKKKLVVPDIEFYGDYTKIKTVLAAVPP